MLENLDEALRNPLYESLIEFDEPEDEMDYAEESKKVDINSLTLDDSDIDELLNDDDDDDDEPDLESAEVIEDEFDEALESVLYDDLSSGDESTDDIVDALESIYEETEEEIESALESLEGEFDDDLDSALEFQDTKSELARKALIAVNPTTMPGYAINRGFRVAHIRKRLPIINKADDVMDEAKKISKSDPQGAIEKMKSAQKMYERALQQALSARWCNSTVESYLKNKIDRCRAYILKFDGDGRSILEIMKSFAKERRKSVKDARKRLKSGEDLGAEESWVDFEDDFDFDIDEI